MVSTSSVPMPRAMAVWLIEHTALTFEQIADFCRLNIGEVRYLADEEEKLIGIDPIKTGQLSKEMIEECTNDPVKRLVLINQDDLYGKMRKKRGRKYTPIARRQDKPNAIAWILKYCAEMDDNHIVRLIGTTKYTISAVRNKVHWNMGNIRPCHPVSLGLCTQEDFEQAVFKIKVAAERSRKLKEFRQVQPRNAVKEDSMSLMADNVNAGIATPGRSSDGSVSSSEI